MFKRPDERFGIERLVSTSGSDGRPSIGNRTIRERLDELLDDKIPAGEILEREAGPLGIHRAGRRGVRLGVYGRIVRHFDGCRQSPAGMDQVRQK